MATVYDKSSLFLAPSGVSNGTVFVQKPVPIHGPELVTNGDFSQEGAEIADNNTISNAGGSIITKTSALNYNATSDGTGGSSIRPKLAFDGATSGKSYVIRITPTNQSGLIEFKLYDGSSYVIDNSNLSTYLEFYFKYDGASTFLAFDGTNAFNVDFEISLKEVGQDWTLTVPEITIGESEVNFNSVANASSIRQYDALTVGKIYKATYTISNYSLGGAKIRIGGVQGTQRQANGTYTEYITATLDTSVRVYAVSTTSLSITNISVQEVLIPAGDFAFTRGSNLSATRINEAQLIEKGRENLLLQSNQFDTTWALTNDTSVIGGQEGYDGSNDAWLLTKDDNQYRAVYQNISVTGVWTLSVYAKANTLDIITLRDGDSQGRVEFDLSDGSVSDVRTENIIAYDISSVGNDWYRCQVSFSGTTSRIQFYAEFNDPTEAGSIYIQDAQLEQGLAATSVITTGAGTVQAGLLENTPRLDYSGGATCPSLLLEPSRTNLITNSEYFDTSPWINRDVTTIENATTSPEGVQNATRINFSGTGLKRIEQNTPNNAGPCTASIYMKYIDHPYILARLDSPSGAKYAMYNIQTGNIESTTMDNAEIIPVGDGWYRLIASQDTNAGQEIFWYFAETSTVNTGSWTGSGSLYAYGAMFEEGSYPTSYIPTYGTTQTRAVEDVELPSLSSVFDSTGDYTILFEVERLSDVNESQFIYLRSSIFNYITLSATTLGRCEIVLYDGTGATAITPNNSFIPNSSIKIAIRISGNTCSAFSNGSELTLNNTSVTPRNFDRYQNNRNHRKYQEVYFPTALSDLDCKILTGATTYATFGEMALALNYTVYE